MSTNSATNDDSVVSFDPATGREVDSVRVSSPADVTRVTAASGRVAQQVAAESPDTRSRWLDSVAAALEAEVQSTVSLATSETGLSEDRLRMELGSTVAQWRFYAQAARDGSWLDATIDHSTGAVPDLRRVHTSAGPVAVFGASNFPLGYGMLGHDTATALAAGSPVVVKAHPAHPRLSGHLESVGSRALADAGAPPEVFQVVHGLEAGSRLVVDPQIMAVAFTGSQRGGQYLVSLAQRRSIPIPVFAEMGTVNPVILTPSVGDEETAELAEQFVGSVQFGAGQVCTKPGLVFVPRGSRFKEFASRFVEISEPPGWALTRAIGEGYDEGRSAFDEAGAVLLASGPSHEQGWALSTSLYEVELERLEQGSPFVEECFGPAGLIVEYDTVDGAATAVRQLHGALTASVFTAPGPDSDVADDLVRALTSKVGRVVYNQWPSMVWTSWAQHHGGPWPATSDPAATSVGAAAMRRFLTPRAFQNVPERLLPPALQDANPWDLPRRVDGRLVLREESER